MIKLSRIMVLSVRQVLLAVAILATLTPTFGLLLHLTVAGDHHQHVVGEPCANDHDRYHDDSHHHDTEHHDSQHDQALLSTCTDNNNAGNSCDGRGNDSPGSGDGHCHCSCHGLMPSAMLPATTQLPVDAYFTRIVRPAYDVLIPNSISFQPDPPPAKG